MLTPEHRPHSRPNEVILAAAQNVVREFERLSEYNAAQNVMEYHLARRVVELEEQLEALQEKYDALWQEIEHPFDKSEYDRMFERLEAVTRERDEERERFHLHVETMIEPKILQRCEDYEQERAERIDDIQELQEQLETLREELHNERGGYQMCAVVTDSSWHSPVACAFQRSHTGDHSWASIPQFDPRKEHGG